MRIAGIGVYVHITFLLLLAWVGYDAYTDRHRWSDVAGGLILILVLFGIVVLHELGHALTARRFGIQTRDITLLPIGGVARLERMPDDPRQELLVALAGPAVNVALAILCFAALGIWQQLALLTDLGMTGMHFLVTLLWVNVGLTLFNLVPAFPMDGGRVLRALLATRLNYARATSIAAGVGQVVAVLFAFVGLCSLFGLLGPFSNPFLVLIGLFVWMGATQESNQVQMKSALGGVAVSQVMITHFHTVSPGESLRRAIELLLAGWQHDFPVVEHGQLAGMLTRRALVDGLAQRGPDTLIGEAMERQVATVSWDEPVETVLARLRASDTGTMLVARGPELLGLLTAENISEYLLIQAALHGAPDARKWGFRLAERPAA